MGMLKTYFYRHDAVHVIVRPLKFAYNCTIIGAFVIVKKNDHLAQYNFPQARSQ